MAVQAEPTSQSLKKVLRVRHLVMLSVGGTIASGFFLGSGGAIALAGPGVIVTYLIAGFVAIGVMACLAELTIQGQTAAGFADYATRSMGGLVGFLTGWNYWLAWIGGSAAEAIAVGTFAQALGPLHTTPVWLIALVVLTVDLAINLIGVLLMGNYEFGLSTIKIVAMIVFSLVCFAAVLGIGMKPIGLSNFTNHGGFLPLGVSGLFTSFLLVFYAYTGIEMVSVGSEESLNPKRDVPRALMGTAVLVTVLFIASAAAMLAVIPWQKLGTSSSPVVDALQAIHQPTLATLVTFAIILASVSAIDCGVYSGSRMLFAFARDSYFPKWIAETGRQSGVPTRAVVISGGLIYVGVIVDLLSPAYAYVLLGSLATLGFMWAWVTIPVMQMLYRRRLGADGARDLKWRVPFYPLTPVVVVLLVLVAIVGPIFSSGPGLFGLSSGATPVVAGAVWVALWAAYYVLVGRPMHEKAGELPAASLSDGH